MLHVSDSCGGLRSESRLDGTSTAAVSILTLGLVSGRKVVAKYLFIPSKLIQAG